MKRGRHHQSSASDSLSISKKDLEEEQRLEEQLFGALSEKSILVTTTQEALDETLKELNDDLGEEGKSPTLKRDGGAAWEDEDSDGDGGQVDLTSQNRLKKLRQSPGEVTIGKKDYESRLRKRFQSSHPLTGWAAKTQQQVQQQKKEEEDVSDEEEQLLEEALRDSRSLVGNASQRIMPGLLEIGRLKDANIQEPSRSVVQSVQFHPQGELLLTAGFDKTLRFFNIDGDDNPKVHGVFFPDMPISMAAFAGNSGHVVVAGRRPFFYWYDLDAGRVTKVPRIFGRTETSLDKFTASPDGQWLAFTGKNGYVILVSNRTKQWVADLKMNGKCRDLAFSPDSKYLIASGSDADVYTWDIRSRRCTVKYHDEGGTLTTALAVSSQGSWKYTAVGSESGVVNLYKNNALDVTQKPSHLKAVMNLTTEIDKLKFNCDSQILAITSRGLKDSVKLVHLPSCSVFSNWPTAQTPIGYASCVDFSPNGGLLAVGNAKGRVLLYRVKHYANL